MKWYRHTVIVSVKGVDLKFRYLFKALLVAPLDILKIAKWSIKREYGARGIIKHCSLELVGDYNEQDEPST